MFPGNITCWLWYFADYTFQLNRAARFVKFIRCFETSFIYDLHFWHLFVCVKMKERRKKKMKTDVKLLLPFVSWQENLLSLQRKIEIRFETGRILRRSKTIKKLKISKLSPSLLRKQQQSGSKEGIKVIMFS